TLVYCDAAAERLRPLVRRDSAMSFAGMKVKEIVNDDVLSKFIEVGKMPYYKERLSLLIERLHVGEKKY
uniref:hypothetical protein n=1 Tax=Klebsiella pneumoniae TaxID=573 RepID=UPI001953798A